MEEGQKHNSKRTFTEKFRKTVVAEILSGETQETVGQRYNISRTTITEWLKKYGGKKYYDIQRNVYSSEFKDRICMQIDRGILDVSQARIKYQISSNNVIRLWLSNYRKTYGSFIEETTAAMGANQETPPSLDDIKQRLQEAELKIKALETMIIVAEQTYKIQIRKKFCAKQ